MASPAIQTTNSGNNQTLQSTHTLNLPASIASGDTLLMFFGHKDTTGATPGWPAGWNQFADANNNAGSLARMDVAWRKADGTEGATISVTTTNTTRQAHASYRINGATDPTVTPPEGTTATASNTNTPDPPSITPSGGSNDYLIVVAFCSSHGRITSSVPTNYNTNVGSGDNSGTAARAGCGSANRALTAATTEDPGTFTTTGTGVEETASVTIAIYPSGAAGPTADPYPFVAGKSGYYPTQG